MKNFDIYEDRTRIKRLSDYEEAVGLFKGNELKDGQLLVIFDAFQLVFSENTVEAKLLQERLSDDLIGKKVALLKLGNEIFVRLEHRDDCFITKESYAKIFDLERG